MISRCGRLLSAALLIVIFFFSRRLGSLWAAGLPDTRASSPPARGSTVSGVANLIRYPANPADYRVYLRSLSAPIHFRLLWAGFSRRQARERTENDTAERYGLPGIVRVAVINRYNAQTYNRMTIDQLKAYIDAQTPVLLTIQAWPEKTVDWSQDWKDGHYVVAIGYDSDNIYFMDPATIGNYTYIPVDEFLARWHDKDQRKKKLINFGIVIDGKEPAYDPEQIKPLD